MHVTTILFFFGGGAHHPWKEGEQGCESLRGMESGILLVMYYTHSPGKRGGGCSVWVFANVVTVPKYWGLATTPLTTALWENLHQIVLCCSANKDR